MELAVAGRIPAKGGIDTGDGGAGTENVRRAEKIAEAMRKIREELTLAEASELDKSRIKHDAWFEEQRTKLQELGAGDAEYSELVRAYAAKRHKDMTEWANRTSEVYLAIQRERDAQLVKDEQADRDAATAARIADKKAEHEITLKQMKVYYATDSDLIRVKAGQEREILGIRQESLLNSITEHTTFEQTNELMRQYWALQQEIERSKRVEVEELDLRRVELQREINDLTLAQSEMLRQQTTDQVARSLGELGAGNLAGYAVENAALVRGVEEGPARGTDVYSREYQDWMVLQDQKIMALYELGNQEQAIKDAFREYDLRAEQVAQQQKFALAKNTMGLVAGIAESLYVATGSRNKALFRVMQMASIGEAIINTYTGATKALAQGGFYGIVMAAAVIAAGMAQVAKIRSQTYDGGGGGGGGSVSLSGGGMPSAPALPAAPVEEKRVVTPAVNIHVYGNIVDQDAFAREMVPAITKAISDGVQ
jgi:hypothetical protein